MIFSHPLALQIRGRQLTLRLFGGRGERMAGSVEAETENGDRCSHGTDKGLMEEDPPKEGLEEIFFFWIYESPSFRNWDTADDVNRSRRDSWFWALAGRKPP